MRYLLFILLLICSSLNAQELSSTARFNNIRGQTNNGNIVINGSTSGALTLERPATITDNTVQWWTTGPSSGQFLRWDGTRMDWEAIAGGGDVLAANIGTEYTANAEAFASNTVTTPFWSFADGTIDKGLFGGVRNPDALAGSHINYSLGIADNTNAFTMRWHGMLPTTVSTNFALTAMGPNPVGISSNSLFMYINSSGRLAVGISGATVSDTRTRTNSGTAFLTTYGGKIVNIFGGRDGTGTPFAYVADRKDNVALGNDTTAGTPPAWGDNVSITNWIIGAAFTNDTWFGRVYQAEPYFGYLNLLEAYTNAYRGPQSYQEYGSTTPRYASTFTAGVDSWTTTQGTVAGNVDSIGGQDDTLAYAPENASGAKTFFRLLSTIPSGKGFIVEFDFWNPSTNVGTFGICFGLVTSGLVGPTNNTRDAWTPYHFEGVRLTNATSWMRLNLLTNGTTSSWTANGADRVFIKNFRIYQSGVLARPDLQHVDPRISNLARGRTTNNFIGTLVGTSLEQMNPIPQLLTPFLMVSSNSWLADLFVTNTAMIATARVDKVFATNVFAGGANITNTLTVGTVRVDQVFATNIQTAFAFVTNGLSVVTGSITGAYNSAHSGNVFRQKKLLEFRYFDNITGATVPNTNNMTTNNFMRPVFSNSADEGANYIEFYGNVPADWDTATDPRAKVTFKLGGADTAAHRYVLSTVSPAASAHVSGTVGTAINLDFAGDASGANDDIEQVGFTALTGWGSALTAGRHWVVRLARDGNNGTEDASTVDSMFFALVIEYTAKSQ